MKKKKNIIIQHLHENSVPAEEDKSIVCATGKYQCRVGGVLDAANDNALLLRQFQDIKDFVFNIEPAIDKGEYDMELEWETLLEYLKALTCIFDNYCDNYLEEFGATNENKWYIRKLKGELTEIIHKKYSILWNKYGPEAQSNILIFPFEEDARN